MSRKVFLDCLRKKTKWESLVLLCLFAQVEYFFCKQSIIKFVTVCYNFWRLACVLSTMTNGGCPHVCEFWWNVRSTPGVIGILGADLNASKNILIKKEEAIILGTKPACSQEKKMQKSKWDLCWPSRITWLVLFHSFDLSYCYSTVPLQFAIPTCRHWF